MKILSIDPGFNNFGIAIIDTNDPKKLLVCGNLEIKTKTKGIREQIRAFREMLWSQCFLTSLPVDVVLIEGQFKGQLKVMETICHCEFYPAISIHPMKVKHFYNFKSISYRANKAQSVEIARKICPDFDTQCGFKRMHDVSDAYLQAIYFGIQSNHISKDILNNLTQLTENEQTLHDKQGPKSPVTPEDGRGTDSCQSSDAVFAGRPACQELPDNTVKCDV